MTQDQPEQADTEAAPERAPVPLLEPREGLPPLVTTAPALAAAIATLAAGEGPLAVDAERASGYRYGHRAFLVQLRRHKAGTVLIDPVACPDLSGLDAGVGGCEAVLHAASQDLPCLAELGFQPRELFDTELAGRLLGYPRVGLGVLVETVLGWTLEKGHAAADWSTRPLPTDWLRYAALDVEVLVELRDALAAELTEQGKTEWARQEFAAVLAAKPPPPRADPWRRTSGIHRVHTRRGLAVVRELWLERDKVARRRDLSPGRVLPDAAIVEAARAVPGTQHDLTELAGFRGRGARRHAPDWQRAVDRARLQAEPDLPGTTSPLPEGPPPAHRWAERDPVAARRLAAVRTVVAALADEHCLPAENLLPPDVVRRVAWRPPEPPEPEPVGANLADHGARPWQVGLTATPISKALSRLIEKGED
ncbi:MAG TPA: HRDC domain-containing protein [Streptosporangiaceae bacterium]|nr:HRDC domain-containing protein [Streptosporangiaceae bacterium]